MTGADDSRFGLSDEDVLRMLIREEVAEGIRLALADPLCPRPCKRVTDLQDTVYGDGNANGLKGRVTTLEAEVQQLVWWNRATIVAALGAVGAVIASLVAH